MNRDRLAAVIAFVSGVGFTSTTVAVAEMHSAPIEPVAFAPLALGVVGMIVVAGLRVREESDSEEVSI